MSPSAAAGAFEGFPEGTLGFLRGLSANNEKRWFDAHRGEYERFYVTPALAFIAAIGPRLQADVDAATQFEPRVNGSLFRIQRDIRFSKDKTPYKPNLDMWFWQGDRKGWDTPGFFFRLAVDSLILGAGMHQFAPDALRAFREAVVEAQRGAQLAQLAESIEAGGDYRVGAETRKTVPRGFDARHERARFLRFEGLRAELTTPIPVELGSTAFVDYCVGHFKTVSPINEWLRQALAPAV